MLHFIFGQLGFLALISAGFVFASHFASAKQSGWVAFSAFASGFFLASIVAGVAAMGASWTLIALWIAVALGWVWLTALSLHTMRTL